MTARPGGVRRKPFKAAREVKPPTRCGYCGEDLTGPPHPVGGHHVAGCAYSTYPEPPARPVSSEPVAEPESVSTRLGPATAARGHLVVPAAEIERRVPVALR